mmetsp:Transcript_164815/g.523946  ORF Transcript_164815/g.523946 Transcript_164815/m.523946 type:complete len:212 (-) Transcript_164815:149-784(-)
MCRMCVCVCVPGYDMAPRSTRQQPLDPTWTTAGRKPITSGFDGSDSVPRVIVPAPCGPKPIFTRRLYPRSADLHSQTLLLQAASGPAVEIQKMRERSSQGPPARQARQLDRDVLGSKEGQVGRRSLSSFVRRIRGSSSRSSRSSSSSGHSRSVSFGSCTVIAFDPKKAISASEVVATPTSRREVQSSTTKTSTTAASLWPTMPKWAAISRR